MIFVIINVLNLNQKQVKGSIAHILIFFADPIYHKHTFRMPITRKKVSE
jgi:hypothetical protein